MKKKKRSCYISFPVYLIVMNFFLSLYFCAVLHNTPTLLPVPMQVVAEACAVSGLVLVFFIVKSISIVETPYHFVIPFIFIAQDSEETLSDECPLEEVPVSA